MMMIASIAMILISFLLIASVTSLIIVIGSFILERG